METNNEKEFDEFLKGTIRSMDFEPPSANFTDLVMAKVQKASEKNRTVVYSPLISKAGWYSLAFLVMMVLSFILFGDRIFGVTWFSGPGSAWDSVNVFWRKVPTFQVSNIVVYGFVILALFVWIQVVLLKHYFEKRIA